MSETKSAVIIGAGVGGIATAIQLARHGFQVHVYEKNASPGGRCGQILRDGHRFDLGATIYLMPSIYRDVFASMGLTIEDCFESRPLPVIYRMYFDDGEVFDFTTDEVRLKQQAERLEPGSYDQLKTYITTGYTLFELAMKKLLGRNFYNIFQFINFSNIGLVFKIKAHIRHMDYVSRFVKHPHLQKTFTFQNIYVGQNPYTAPALFSMLPAAELSEGSLFPVGGMYRIVETLLNTAESLGVTFHYSSPVDRILVGRHKAEGILLEKGTTVQADIVVANADLPYVYKALLPGKFHAARLGKLQHSCSAIVFHWGLDTVYPQLSHHGVFLTEPYRKNFHRIFHDKSLSDTPSFYVHAPVGSDPSAAPVNQDSITILVPVGHLDTRKKQDWEKMKQTARAFVIERLKKQGLDDIDQHIKFELSGSPETWNSNYNISKGSVFGSVSHNILQMGYFRPHNKHNRYRNLYFVGGSTHPGNGVPLVLLSSKLTSERILKDTNHQ